MDISRASTKKDVFSCLLLEANGFLLICEGHHRPVHYDFSWGRWVNNGKLGLLRWSTMNICMYIYIYRICSFILGPSRPHTFWVLCEMVVPRMPNTRCTKTYMSDGNGKKKQEVHQQSSIPFHPPVLIPPVDGALHAMLSRLGSSTISSTCTAKQPRLTSWHGKCSRNSTPIRSNPTFVSSFAACNGLQSIRSIKKKQKTITKNKEKRQTQNLQKARKNIMEGKSLTYLLKENSNW